MKKRFFRKRWIGEDKRVAAILNAIQSGNDWTVFLVKDSSHQFETLSGIEVSNLPILNNNKAVRDLRGINLRNIQNLIFLFIS